MTNNDARVGRLNQAPDRAGSYVLYWMQASMRARHNPALESAIACANERGLPCLVVSALTEGFPGANARHYRFLLEGLAETQTTLAERNAEFILLQGEPVETVAAAASEAALVITDASYLREPRRRRKELADRLSTALVQIEGDMIVPVGAASSKEEYSAATLRRKLQPLIEKFSSLPEEQHAECGPDRIDTSSIAPAYPHLEQLLAEDPQRVLDAISVDHSIPASRAYRGGFSEAEHRLNEFIDQRLAEYNINRNDPALSWVSNLSAYLHFGQISPLYIARRAQAALPPDHPGLESFLEELIVRRELAMNFTHYNPHYDSFECLPNWAKETLRVHSTDARLELYSLRQLEHAETSDRYWNAAQLEMLRTGKMHGYMRMYWGKRLIEWHRRPEAAFETAVHLNDTYELDGRDPNGYAGIAWCFGKHDRGWPERPIFGKVRSMTAGGLKRKFDIEAYAERWS